MRGVYIPCALLKEKKMTANIPVITIDGPGGAGKGTLCKAMAEALGWHLLDSGAIYRVLALAALHHHVDVESEEALVPWLPILTCVLFLLTATWKWCWKGKMSVAKFALRRSRTRPRKWRLSARSRSAAAPPARLPRTAGAYRRRSRYGNGSFPGRAGENFPRCLGR